MEQREQKIQQEWQVILGYRRLIKSTDSCIEMISVPKREVIDETISNRFVAIPECVTPPRGSIETENHFLVLAGLVYGCRVNWIRELWTGM